VIGSVNIYRWLLVGIAALSLLSEARGLDPNRLVSQYGREQWSIGSQLGGGSVNALAQTSDGYLWIGTDKGLIRFDGFDFRSISLASSPAASEVSILGILEDADGNLWVHPQGGDVMRQREGKFETVAVGAGAARSQITALSKGSRGEVLVSDLIEGIFRFHGQTVQKLAAPGVLPGSSPVIALAETTNGKIWMGALGAGLFLLTDGRATRISEGLPDRKINCLLAISDDDLWVGTDTGLYRWNGKALRRAKLPSSFGNLQVLSMLRDRDSNIWVGTARGLLRINANGVSFSEEEELRGSGGINALLEDREGNLWIGGARGLGRIRDSAFVTYSRTTGLGSEHNGPVYADAQGRAWLGSGDGGLYVLKAGRVQSIVPAMLANDVVYSISGRENEIWLGRQRGGLTRLLFHNGTTATTTYTEASGLAQNSVYAVFQARDGTVWAGTLSGGLSRFKDGRFTTYSVRSGLASNTVSSILETHDGKMWFATSNGLSSFANGGWRTYRTRDGLPSDSVNCLFEDSSGTLWTGTAGGLAFLASGSFQVPGGLPDVLRDPIFGLAADRNASLWIATANHILQVRRDKLLAGTIGVSDFREYGSVDGLPSSQGMRRDRSVVSDSQGRIWFSLIGGISVIDPSHVAENSVPAIAHIEAIAADGNPIETSNRIRIPGSHKRITFAYTAVSLAVPERIRFRYIVDGFDRSWSEPVSAREAAYTNLGPGSYRFRILASNSYGQWNGSESVLNFEVEPAFWQTWWFRSGSVVLLGFAALFLYRFHLHRISHELSMRFEERLAERTRIAQELHDTLLQGFLSASMQLHVADDHLSETSPAKPTVRRVLELMKDVIAESRNTVRGLRSPNEGPRELDLAFSKVPDELGANPAVDFRVIVEGQSRPLSPFIRDDVYRMGREAIVNAFRHSEANSVQLELEYGSKELRVLVRDNGKGMDERVLRSGREGHWGLPGIRERAERIGARLRLWSHPARGTEVEISVPAHIAFESNPASWASNWIMRLHIRKQTIDSQSKKRVG
jgi:ligand-binding sensor domain-containing protein/signal transduction histidine kinase